MPGNIIITQHIRKKIDMAFDACFMYAVANELNRNISGARVEKIQQPEKDELVMILHRERESIKLSVSAGANNPRINITNIVKENPKSAPMFCMLLRKYLIGSKILTVTQLKFERVLEIKFEAYDELGILSNKYLIVEIMGKYSNIIFCDINKKIIGAIKVIDFSTSQKRQILPGMQYELPPSQNKYNPLEITEEDFNKIYKKNDIIPSEKFITDNFMGISALTAREIVYRAEKNYNGNLWNSFYGIINKLRNNEFLPVLIYDKNEIPVEYSFMNIAQYGNTAQIRVMDSFGQLIDEFYGLREKSERLKQRSNDIIRLISNIKSRLLKKIALQESDLRSCADKEKYKLYGDLIISNIYKLERGMKKAKLTNYYSENNDNIEKTEVILDECLTPAQNAQRYYKRYNKAKSAERELTNQLKLAKAELDYIHSVEESLTRAETEADINEIRRELYESGYASRMKDFNKNPAVKQKNISVKPLEFRTDGGFRILCGKNNNQNDYITTKTASRSDYWFHVKNAPGSHVILFCDGKEPSESDLAQAAVIAAYYSQLRESKNIPVDYTHVRNVKKPNGAKPGFVIYTSNKTAYITPDINTINRLKI